MHKEVQYQIGDCVYVNPDAYKFKYAAFLVAHIFLFYFNSFVSLAIPRKVYPKLLFIVHAWKTLETLEFPKILYYFSIFFSNIFFHLWSY